MVRFRDSAQLDLFANSGSVLPAEAPPSELIARIRGELTGTLARVRGAVAFPWTDVTAATLAELRFNSIAGWLPDDEARELRISFQHEMDRLYAIANKDNPSH